ncbi:MAG: glycosyltransferase family 4 protein [Candidatus Methanoperedens sp.]|nr:glycosyltransferase family 4 protein [Candidatus Methanoperedens sp.]CAG0995341.1 1,2-diacylglycerol 3-alpha-glucosyltransferase [Methanosarcinales archaeon]
MKIAFVYDAIYPWVKGGAEKRIYELGKRLVAKGNEVHIFGVKWWDGADIIQNEGMVLHGVCGKMELYINGRRSIKEAIIFSIMLFPHLIKEKFDVIDVSVFPYFSCFSVKIVSMSKRIPMITTWHEIWEDYWYEYLGNFGFVGKFIERLVSRMSNHSIAVSDHTKKGLESLGIDHHNIHVVTNGIDIIKINQIKSSIYTCDIIFIGRFIKEKNLDILIESVDHIKKDVPDIECHIIGGGPEEKKLKGMVFDLGLQSNIKFFGFLDQDDVIAKLKSSKVLVLPSSREGFGIVVIEAFACCVPVITVRSPGNAAQELVNEDTGFVVNPNAREIGDSIYTIVTDDKFRKKISENAFLKSKEYDWDKKTIQLLNIYNGLI